MSDYTASGEPRDRRRGGWALALAVVALLLMATFQTIGVMRDRTALARESMAQQPAVDQGQKLRVQLQAIAGKTAELANAGDNAARDVLDLMHREGVTITPPKPSQP